MVQLFCFCFRLVWFGLVCERVFTTTNSNAGCICGSSCENFRLPIFLFLQRSRDPWIDGKEVQKSIRSKRNNKKQNYWKETRASCNSPDARQLSRVMANDRQVHSNLPTAARVLIYEISWWWMHARRVGRLWWIFFVVLSLCCAWSGAPRVRFPHGKSPSPREIFCPLSEILKSNIEITSHGNTITRDR